MTKLSDKEVAEISKNIEDLKCQVKCKEYEREDLAQGWSVRIGAGMDVPDRKQEWYEQCTIKAKQDDDEFQIIIQELNKQIESLNDVLDKVSKRRESLKQGNGANNDDCHVQHVK